MTPDPCGASSATAEASTTKAAVTVGSLCTGYAGLDLGLALALGVPVRHAWHVEYDKHPSKILAHRFPTVPNYGDVTTLDHAGMEWVEWLTAGYPCQPFSKAGLRKGAADARHLWPHIATTIGALRPRHVLLENVRGHVSLGLDAVLGEMAELGYDARWGVVRASEAGACHERARVFIVATDTDGGERGGRGRPGALGSGAAGAHREGLQRQRPGHAADDRGAAAPDAGGERHGCGEDAGSLGRADRGLEGQARERQRPREEPVDRGSAAWGQYAGAVHRWELVLGRAAPNPTEPGPSGQRLSPAFAEWMMGLPAGWVTDVPDLPRSAQLKALGNGVVPQQAALAVRLLTGATAAEVAA